MPRPSRPSRPGRHEHVCRVTGFDADSATLAPSLSEQCRQAFVNGADLLAERGLTIGDVTRVVYLVRDSHAFSTCLPVLRDVFGENRPAATLRMVPVLDTPDTGIELELVTAARPAN